MNRRESIHWKQQQQQKIKIVQPVIVHVVKCATTAGKLNTHCRSTCILFLQTFPYDLFFPPPVLSREGFVSVFVQHVNLVFFWCMLNP